MLKLLPGSAWRTPILPELLARVFAPRAAGRLWEWIERNIILDKQQSQSFDGPYRFARTPALRFIADLLNDPAVREIIIKKSSQTGVTQLVLNFIAYCVACNPRNILYVIDSVEEVKTLFTIRLKPMLRRCGATAGELPEDDQKSKMQVRRLYLPGMFVFGVGGYSAGALANKSISLGVLDEADKHPPSPGEEGATVDQLRERFKAVRDFKLVVMSKPVEDDGLITREFETGTQHKLYLPCPHCGELQEFVQERVRYDHCRDLLGDYDMLRVERAAHYRCINAGTPKCPDGIISEEHRRRALLTLLDDSPAPSAPRAEWRQTNFKNIDPGKISLELTDFASLFPAATLGAIAVDLIKAQRSLLKMKQVQANRFARAWHREGITLKVAQVMKLRGPYRRGTVPFPPAALVLTSDVQGDVCKWVKHVFTVSPLAHYIVDWGETMNFDSLLDIFAGLVPQPAGAHREPGGPIACAANGQLYSLCYCGLIDEGYHDKQVRDFVERALESGQMWFTSKGRGGFQVRAMVWESPYQHPADDETRPIRAAYHFHDSALKQELYHGQIGNWQKIQTGESKLMRLWLPEDTDAEFAEELCHEHLVQKDTDLGYTKMAWEKTEGPNDFGDAVKLGKVIWQVIGESLIAQSTAAAPAA